MRSIAVFRDSYRIPNNDMCYKDTRTIVADVALLSDLYLACNQ